MSQSDSDLLSPAKAPAEPSESMIRRTSVEDIARSSARPSRGKRILMKLVRPWTWRKKKKSKKTADQPDPASPVVNTLTRTESGGNLSESTAASTKQHLADVHDYQCSNHQERANGHTRNVSPGTIVAQPLPSDVSYLATNGESNGGLSCTTESAPDHVRFGGSVEIPSSITTEASRGQRGPTPPGAGPRGPTPPTVAPPVAPKPRQVAASVSSDPPPMSPRTILKREKGRLPSEGSIVTSTELPRNGELQKQDNEVVTEAAFQAKKSPAGYLVYSPDDDDSSDEESTDQPVGAVGEVEEGEEGEDEDGQPLKFGNKVLRSDSIAILRERRKNEPIQTIPVDQRVELESKLARRLSQRPSRIELEQRNILPAEKPERDQQFEDARVTLERKLSRRPTVKELRELKILIRFADYAEVVECEDYDRRADKPWTRLSSDDKAAIRAELNTFKQYEMEVHPDSQYMTRFHKP
eukprot:Em0023g116a